MNNTLLRDLAETTLGSPCFFVPETNRDGLLIVTNPHEVRKRIFQRFRKKYSYEPENTDIKSGPVARPLYDKNLDDADEPIKKYSFSKNQFIYTPYDISRSFSDGAMGLHSSIYTWKEFHASVCCARDDVYETILSSATLYGFPNVSRLGEVLRLVYEYPCESAERCFGLHAGKKTLYSLLPSSFYRIKTIVDSAAEFEMWVYCCLFKIASYMTKDDSPLYTFLTDKFNSGFSLNVLPVFECMLCQVAKRSVCSSSNLFTLPVLTATTSMVNTEENLCGVYPPPSELRIAFPSCQKQNNTNFRIVDDKVITSTHDDYTFYHFIKSHRYTEGGRLQCSKPSECGNLKNFWF